MIPPRQSFAGLLTLGWVFGAAAAVGLVIALVAGGGARAGARGQAITVAAAPHRVNAAARPAPAFVAPTARLSAAPPPGSGVVARPQRRRRVVRRHRPAARPRTIIVASSRPAPAPVPIAAPAPAPHDTAAAVVPKPAPKPAPAPRPAPAVVIDDSG